MVDFILQATLGETIKDNPDCLLITLGCGHVFTIDTLDGSLSISEYYDTDESGAFVGLKTPIGYQSRKSCPTCRSPINSPRYNRVTKRDMLDIQDQIAIRQYTADLHPLVEAEKLDLSIDQWKIKTSLQNLPAAQDNYDDNVVHEALTTAAHDNNGWCPAEAFMCNSDVIFGIDGPAATAWQEIANDHLHIYKSLCDMIISFDSPSLLAYEETVLTIVGQEIGRGHLPHVTDEVTEKVYQHLGAPLPYGVTMYKIEAQLETINIRLALANIATAMADHLWEAQRVQQEQGSRDCNNREMGRRFDGMALALLRTADRDMHHAIQLATECKLPKTILLGHVFGAKVAFRSARMQKTQALRTTKTQDRNSTIETLKTGWQAELQSLEARFRKCVSDVRETYGRLGTHVDDCVRDADEIFQDWDEFINTALHDQLTIEEKRQVVRASLEYGE